MPINHLLSLLLRMCNLPLCWLAVKFIYAEVKIIFHRKACNNVLMNNSLSFYRNEPVMGCCVLTGRNKVAEIRHHGLRHEMAPNSRRQDALSNRGGGPGGILGAPGRSSDDFIKISSLAAKQGFPKKHPFKCQTLKFKGKPGQQYCTLCCNTLSMIHESGRL